MVGRIRWIECILVSIFIVFFFLPLIQFSLTTTISKCNPIFEPLEPCNLPQKWSIELQSLIERPAVLPGEMGMSLWTKATLEPLNCVGVSLLEEQRCPPWKWTCFVKRVDQIYLSLFSLRFFCFLSEVIRCDDIYSCSVEEEEEQSSDAWCHHGAPVNQYMQHCSISQLHSGSFKQTERPQCFHHRNAIRARYCISCSKHSSLGLGCHVWFL